MPRGHAHRIQRPPELEEEAVSGSRGTQKADPATARLTGWIAPVVDAETFRPSMASQMRSKKMSADSPLDTALTVRCEDRFVLSN